MNTKVTLSFILEAGIEGLARTKQTDKQTNKKTFKINSLCTWKAITWISGIKTHGFVLF